MDVLLHMMLMLRIIVQVVARHVKRCQFSIQKLDVLNTSLLSLVSEVRLTMDFMSLACRQV